MMSAAFLRRLEGSLALGVIGRDLDRRPFSAAAGLQ